MIPVRCLTRHVRRDPAILNAGLLDVYSFEDDLNRCAALAGPRRNVLDVMHHRTSDGPQT